jgi:hypothetical protein
MSKPLNWKEDADQKMRATGLDPEIILTRALMFGFVPKPHEDSVDADIHWIVSTVSAPDHNDSHTVAFLGTTPEQLAFRWLEWHYPEALVNHDK